MNPAKLETSLENEQPNPQRSTWLRAIRHSGQGGTEKANETQRRSAAA